VDGAAAVVVRSIQLRLALYGLSRVAPRGRASLAGATLIWSVGLFLLSHRQPFARFWLFMLPLFLLCVARGLVLLLDRWPRKLG